MLAKRPEGSCIHFAQELRFFSIVLLRRATPYLWSIRFWRLRSAPRPSDGSSSLSIYLYISLSSPSSIYQSLYCSAAGVDLVSSWANREYLSSRRGTDPRFRDLLYILYIPTAALRAIYLSISFLGPFLSLSNLFLAGPALQVKALSLICLSISLGESWLFPVFPIPAVYISHLSLSCRLRGSI